MNTRKRVLLSACLAILICLHFYAYLRGIDTSEQAVKAEATTTFYENENVLLNDTNQLLRAIIEDYRQATPEIIYQGPEPTPTPNVHDQEACETWRFEHMDDPVYIASNSDMSALSLEYAYSARAARSCAEIDASFDDDLGHYLFNLVDTLEILNAWLLEDEGGE